MKGRLLPLLALLLAACNTTPTATRPMASIPQPGARHADTLLVFLPGRDDRGVDFRTRGFFDIGRDHGFDMLAADAHFGYYLDHSVVRRLHRDIILPARARGYQQIWLLGISVGGLGATLYAQAHPDWIDGLVLLAPYPGDSALVQAIEQAGGLAAWSGRSQAGKPFQRREWRWLQQATVEPGSPRIVLGFGRDDRFATAARLLAARLPREQVFTFPGGHRWPVWRTLWQQVVEAGFPR